MISPKVRKFAKRFEYNPDWGGPYPMLALHPAFGPNRNRAKAFDLSPHKLAPGTWAGTTAQRNLVDPAGRIYATNGSDDRLNFPVSLTYPFTLALWVEDASPREQIYLSAGDSAAAHYSALWSVASSPFEMGLIRYHGTVRSYAGSLRTTRTHLAAVFRARDEAELFIDGVSVGTDTADAGEAATFNRITLGVSADSTPYAWASAKYGEMAAWNCDASAWLPDIYQSSLDGSPSNLWRPIERPVFPAAAVGGAYTVPLSLILECGQ